MSSRLRPTASHHRGREPALTVTWEDVFEVVLGHWREEPRNRRVGRREQRESFGLQSLSGLANSLSSSLPEFVLIDLVHIAPALGHGKYVR